MKPVLALFVVSLLWGSTFVAVKSGLGDASPLLFVALRFSIASLAALPLARGSLRAAWRPGIPLGLTMAVAYSTQTLGLEITTPARSAFVTGLNIAIVPLWAMLLLGKRAHVLSLLGLAVAIPGLWLLTSPGSTGQGWNAGDSWTLVTAVGFALHLVMIQRWAPNHDGGALLVTQLVVTALACLPAAFLMETPRLTFTPALAIALGVTALLAGVGTTWLQLVYQPKVEATRAALIYATEPVFASLFSLWIFGEMLPALGWAGGGLILAGTLLAETGAARSRRPAPIPPPQPTGAPPPETAKAPPVDADEAPVHREDADR